MFLRAETLHFGVEDTDTVHISLFRVLAEQLLSYADAEYWLLKVADDLVEPAGLQVFHRPARLALSWEEHAIGFPQLFRIIGEQWLDTHPSEGVHHRVDVTCIIFYDGYVHYEKIIVLFL